MYEKKMVSVSLSAMAATISLGDCNNNSGELNLLWISSQLFLDVWYRNVVEKDPCLVWGIVWDSSPPESSFKDEPLQGWMKQDGPQTALHNTRCSLLNDLIQQCKLHQPINNAGNGWAPACSWIIEQCASSTLTYVHRFSLMQCRRDGSHSIRYFPIHFPCNRFAWYCRSLLFLWKKKLQH